MSTKCQHCWNCVPLTPVTLWWHFPMATNVSKRFIGRDCFHTHCCCREQLFCALWRLRSTGDPLHSRAACTQPCNVNTHSRAHCSPGARLCEQWGHGCVNNRARLCASARLGRGSPVRSGSTGFHIDVLRVFHIDFQASWKKFDWMEMSMSFNKYILRMYCHYFPSSLPKVNF